jgi:hypothetical protein
MEIHTVSGSGWSVPLGTVTQAPWSLVTSQASIGSYPVMARVTDDLGAQAVATNRVWVGVPRPVNDDFSGRIIIPNTGTNHTALGSNRWASAETGEAYAQRSVWWSWTAPASGAITIDTCGSTLNADLRIYTGVGPTISNLTFFGSASGGPCSSLTFAVLAGTTYHIAVDGVGEEQSQIILNLLTPMSPLVRLTHRQGPINGSFGFSFSGVPGQRSVVEISTNLLYWTPVATNDPGGEGMSFTDSDITNVAQRFYRVHQQ